MMAACLMLVCGGLLLAAEEVDLNKILKQRLELIIKDQERHKELQQVTSGLQSKRNGLQSAIYQLREPAGPQSEERAKALRSQKVELENALARIQADLEFVDRQLALTQLTDQPAREAKAKELQQELNTVQQQITQASAPIEQKYAEVTKALKEGQAAMQDALRPHFKSAPGAWGEANLRSVTWFDNNTGQVYWQDANGKQTAWVAVFMQTQPSNFGNNKLDGKYGYVYRPEVVMISLGHFNLHVRATEKLDETTSLTMIKALIDIDALANAKP